MSDVKHTAGPWEIASVGKTAIRGVGMRMVAITSVHTDSETNAKNALLIAAAPELLEALEELLADTPKCKYECGDDDPDCPHVKARAAIAKAKGGA